MYHIIYTSSCARFALTTTPPSWFSAARPVVAEHRTMSPWALTAAVMTFIWRVLPRPDRPSTYRVHQQWYSKSHLLVDRPLFVRCQQGQVRIQILLAAASVPSQAFSCHFSRVIGRFWQAEVRHGASHRLQSGPIPFLVLGSGIWTYLDRISHVLRT